ncbi:MAG: lipopolysaccharide heptosyltransferase II [Candidatus Omnitrophica bacterium]|nr:lipopolysaccharide heptosyltransferase II [Candidatus Omnitrophota bacterium]MDE2009123.1 lipopolysaccharide heptosyltransferase II [Candidatus Omnitrophota bacterium]MDE2214212.1 lipopolysaccharide heptosyltransferase II [Candidatus Omnitrophota bacterium]MDE2231249.1 lipopolysaccharide heptosyltransferase II [Candidatus Omnitrophota bacterium]
MNNILVVNINWLGDAVFSIPVFKALKKAYPQARISCLCVPRVKEVLEHCPYVDRIIVYDEKGRHRYPWQKLKLIFTLRKKRFDAGFLLHRSMTRSLMVYLAGIPLRIGYGKVKGLLTHPVAMDAEDIHRCDYYLKVPQAYGIKVQTRVCELRLKPEDIQSLDVKLSGAGLGKEEKYVVLNTGGNWDLKRWSPDSFAQLAGRLHEHMGLRVVFSGSGQDQEQCQRIAEASGIPAVIMAGATTLGESLALYKRALVVISADSGPLHLAHGVGADVIGIYGPTRPEITGPRGSGRCCILFNGVGCNKSPCYHLACGNNMCMKSVTVDDVLQAFKKFCA